MRLEISETEMRQAIKKINKSKNWSLKRLRKLINLYAEQSRKGEGGDLQVQNTNYQ